MATRIADIVTRFRAVGLAPVRAAIKSVSDAARRADREANGVGRSGERNAKKMETSFGRMARTVGRDLQRMSANVNRAFVGMTAGAVSTAASITKSLGGAISGLAFNKFTILGGAAGAAGYGLAKGLKALTPLLTGGLALGGAIGAGVFSVLDAKTIKGITEATGLEAQVAGQWQMFANEIGLATDDIAGALTSVKDATLEALDPTTDMSKLFKAMGINVRDQNGYLKDSSQVMFDIADATKNLNNQQKLYLLKDVFGKDAAAIVPLLSKFAGAREKFVAEFEKNKANGLFFTQEQLDRIDAFNAKLGGLLQPLRAFARELFLTFEPFFSQILTRLTDVFTDPGGRADIINSWFVVPFQKGYQLLNDILRVFAGFDLQKAIYGNTGSTPIQNTWVIDLYNFLSNAYRIAKGLGALFLGIGDAILDVAKGIDAIVLKQTGVSISDWMGSTGPADTEAFFRDLGDIAANAFDGAFNAGSLRTSAGRYLGGGMEDLKALVVAQAAPIQAAIDYIKLAWADLQTETAENSGLDKAQTALGKFLILVREAVQYLAQLVPAVFTVFAGGGQAPAGFEFLDKIKVAFDYAKSVVLEIYGVLKPLFDRFDEISRATTGLSGTATAIIGKLGIDVVGKVATPQNGAIAAVAGGAYLAKILKDALLGPATGANNDKTRAQIDADYDRSDSKGVPKKTEYDRPEGDTFENNQIASALTRGFRDLKLVFQSLVATGGILTNGIAKNDVKSERDAKLYAEQYAADRAAYMRDVAVGKNPAPIDAGFIRTPEAERGLDQAKVSETASAIKERVFDLLSFVSAGYASMRDGDAAQAMYLRDREASNAALAAGKGPAGVAVGQSPAQREINGQVVEELKDAILSAQPPVNATFNIPGKAPLKAQGDMPSMQSIANAIAGRT